MAFTGLALVQQNALHSESMGGSMDAQIINRIGLGLAIVGVAILFKWGPPQPAFEGVAAIEMDGDEPDRLRQQANEDRQTYTKMSRIGLGLIFLGFFGQLWGTFLQ